MSKRKFIFDDDDDDDDDIEHEPNTTLPPISTGSEESEEDESEEDESEENESEENESEEGESEEGESDDKESKNTKKCKEIDLATHATLDYDHQEDNMTEQERREMETFIDSDEDDQGAFGSKQYHKDRCDSEEEEEVAVQEFLQALEANKRREQQREERLRNGIKPVNQLTLFEMYNPGRARITITKQQGTVQRKIDTTMFSKRRHTSKPVKEFRYVATNKQSFICTKRGCGNYRETSQWLCMYCTEEKRQESKKSKKNKKRNKIKR